jgi:hypothetical protein
LFDQESAVQFGSGCFVHCYFFYYTLDFASHEGAAGISERSYMINKFTIVILLSVIAIAVGACGGETANNTTIAVNTSNAAPNTNVANTKPDPLGATTPPPQQTVNDAPTLTPVVRKFYEALKNKDDAAVRTVLSQAFTKSLEADMKAENKKNLAAFMAELDTVPEKPVEVRNEKIQGTKAVAEIRGGSYRDWTPFEFTNENGAWKFTGGSPALEK